MWAIYSYSLKCKTQIKQLNCLGSTSTEMKRASNLWPTVGACKNNLEGIKFTLSTSFPCPKFVGNATNRDNIALLSPGTEKCGQLPQNSLVPTSRPTVTYLYIMAADTAIAQTSWDLGCLRLTKSLPRLTQMVKFSSRASISALRPWWLFISSSTPDTSLSHIQTLSNFSSSSATYGWISDLAIRIWPDPLPGQIWLGAVSHTLPGRIIFNCQFVS